MFDPEFHNLLLRKRDETVENNPQAISLIVARLELKPDNIVLDATAGTGQLLPYLFKRLTGSGWVDAYDLSCGLLEQAAAAYGSSAKARFILGDVEHDAIFGASILLLYKVCVYRLRGYSTTFCPEITYTPGRRPLTSLRPAERRISLRRIPLTLYRSMLRPSVSE